MDTTASLRSRTQPRRAGAAAGVAAAAVFIVAASVNIQNPLYTTYAAASGYGPGALTLAFSCYLLGLLPVFVLLGGVSDRIGRRVPLASAVALAGAATLVVCAAPSLPGLAAARFLQGAAMALSAAAGTAFLAEVIEGQDAPRLAAVRVGAMTALGFGGAPLVTSVLFLAGEHLVTVGYVAHAAFAFVVAASLAGLRYTPRRQPVPWVRLPAFPAGSLVYGLVLLTAWAVNGVNLAIVPSALAAHGAGPWSGFAVFMINAAGLAVQPAARRIPPEAAVRIGFLLLPAGYGLLTWGAVAGDLPLLLAGAAVAGTSCYGFTYLGTLGCVSILAGEERARAVSGYFMCGYLGLCLPATATGVLADAVGLPAALLAFGAVMLAATVALFVACTRQERGTVEAPLGGAAAGVR